MSGIAITLFVKNPDSSQQGQIFYYDIGDDLLCKDKLDSISAFGSIAGIAKTVGWNTITPDHHGDWLNQRDDGFAEYLPLGDKCVFRFNPATVPTGKRPLFRPESGRHSVLKAAGIPVNPASC
jgi:predicted helicase